MPSRINAGQYLSTSLTSPVEPDVASVNAIVLVAASCARKMLMYSQTRGPVFDFEAEYQAFMKISGPYWMSVLFDRGQDAEVLPPDYYKRFL